MFYAEGMEYRDIMEKAWVGMRNMTPEEFDCFLVNMVPAIVAMSKTSLFSQFISGMKNIHSMNENNFEEFMKQQKALVPDKKFTTGKPNID